MEHPNVDELGIETPEITQVGFVVEDVEDAVERFSKVLGVEPWEGSGSSPQT